MSKSLSRLQAFYQDLSAQALLRVMANKEFEGKIASLTSFGADSAVLLALIADVKPDLPIFFLDTGKHFPATLDFARELTEQLKLTNVIWLKPDETLLGNIDKDGTLWKDQPNRCCWLRKVEPLERAMEDYKIEAMITGRKRYQTAQRANMETIEQDEKDVFRINPLSHWGKGQLEEFTERRGLPTHPLIAEGFLSIGCEPCTSIVKEGQDERAGRWMHTFDGDDKKTECGLHVAANNTNWSV
ncbi:MAG: phosphoadenylyl-sulfate reductase [Rickettsiales bacterium]|nr:phosphoadenylyl-sulfate reductase [Rickettsiales bacterium]